MNSPFPLFPSAPLLAAFNADPYILAFSFVTVAITVWMGFRSAKTSKTASDFFVAGRSVGVGMNASAISGEYLSAASFMGIAGMVMSSGYDALWYPVCYACGYLFLLLFIAGPLRRFGAYTIPDFAEGRFDSPVFRKIAVVFVLFIGFFYTMPQMKGAGTTLAYIFPGLPYWAGVVLVGAVITLNVALGGMKGITLVQAFQYWAKMFAISVPIFVLMAVYGHYGTQLKLNDRPLGKSLTLVQWRVAVDAHQIQFVTNGPLAVADILRAYSRKSDALFFLESSVTNTWMKTATQPAVVHDATAKVLESFLERDGIRILHAQSENIAVPGVRYDEIKAAYDLAGLAGLTKTEIPNRFKFFYTGPVNRSAVRNPGLWRSWKEQVKEWFKPAPIRVPPTMLASEQIGPYAAVFYEATKKPVWLEPGLFEQKHSDNRYGQLKISLTNLSRRGVVSQLTDEFKKRHIAVIWIDEGTLLVPSEKEKFYRSVYQREGMYPFTTNEVSGRVALPAKAPADTTWLNPFGPLTTKAAKTAAAAIGKKAASETNSPALTHPPTHSPEAAWLAKHEKPLALLYTYSLIIAIVCGTAGLPHILVRFYTNPDGVAAKRTTMWVMILIGVFYVFPPVFGVIGRNLLPDLYNGLGAKGTDKIVLELPRLLNEKYPPLGSILSGITCAGAFAAFMSTFSGLLVSMTGALAHDVYGRILRPKSTPEQRMRMFKLGAVLIGGVAIVLGSFVEPLEINFMVGQAFAIAAASYFPLLFMAVWWRKLTMKGAAIGMLAGGVCALVAAALTNFSNLASDKGPMGKIFSGFAPLNDFWAAHPLLRILCEQPAIWAVPLAIILMIVVSKLTAKTIPSDSRMKMLVLHAPEQLGLKQEYIQEHQAGPGH